MFSPSLAQESLDRGGPNSRNLLVETQILLPEHLPNELISKYSRGFAINKITSSVNIRSLTCLSPTLIPSKTSLSSKYLAKGSSARSKSRGDNGQPCLVPLSRLNGGERKPGVCF